MPGGCRDRLSLVNLSNGRITVTALHDTPPMTVCLTQRAICVSIEPPDRFWHT